MTFNTGEEEEDMLLVTHRVNSNKHSSFSVFLLESNIRLC